MLDFASVLTFSGEIGLDGEHRGYEFLRYPGLCLPLQNLLFNFTTLNPFPAFLRPQSVYEGDDMWNLPVLCIRKPKVNYAGVNLIISKWSEVKLRIKQFYSNILTKRESNKITKRIIVKEGAEEGLQPLQSLPWICPCFLPLLYGKTKSFYTVYLFQRYSNSLWFYFCRFALHQRFTRPGQAFSKIQDGVHLFLANGDVWVKGTI